MSDKLAQAKATGSTIQNLIQKNMAEIAKLVPKHVTPDRLLKVMVGCISKTPLLGMCTPESLVNSFKVAAELGLEPGGALGHLYLVPFGTECTPIIGYRGLIELARRSGQLGRIEAHVVYKRDSFHITHGLSPALDHTPVLEGDQGPMIAVYAVAWLKDGTPQVEVMRIDDVNRIRERSRASKNGPWVTDFAEMAKKTVVRRLAKYLPLSAEMSRAFEVDDDDYVDGQVVADDVLPAALESATEKAKKKIAGKLQIPAEAEAPRPTPPPDNGFPTAEEIAANEAEQNAASNPV